MIKFQTLITIEINTVQAEKIPENKYFSVNLHHPYKNELHPVCSDSLHLLSTYMPKIHFCVTFIATPYGFSRLGRGKSLLKWHCQQHRGTCWDMLSTSKATCRSPVDNARLKGTTFVNTNAIWPPNVEDWEWPQLS